MNELRVFLAVLVVFGVRTSVVFRILGAFIFESIKNRTPNSCFGPVRRLVFCGRGRASIRWEPAAAEARAPSDRRRTRAARRCPVARVGAHSACERLDRSLRRHADPLAVRAPHAASPQVLCRQLGALRMTYLNASPTAVLFTFERAGGC